MIINPEALLGEMARLMSECTPIDHIKISCHAFVVFPYHIELDEIERAAQGGIRINEMLDADLFYRRLKQQLSEKNCLLESYGKPPLDFDDLYTKYCEYAAALRPFVVDIPCPE